MAIFYLFVTYITPDPSTRAQVLDRIATQKDAKGPAKRGAKGYHVSQPYPNSNYLPLTSRPENLSLCLPNNSQPPHLSRRHGSPLREKLPPFPIPTQWCPDHRSRPILQHNPRSRGCYSLPEGPQHAHARPQRDSQTLDLQVCCRPRVRPECAVLCAGASEGISPDAVCVIL